MDGSELRQKITELFQKYRYAALVLLAGIFLMLLPMGKTDSQPEQEEIIPSAVETDFETRLAQILSLVHGAGQVQVFLSETAGEETLYQTDEDTSLDDIRRDTVLITGSDRTQSGLVRRIDPPIYQGAIVLCQGADNAAIRLAITQAVANATGLGTDQISVLKMK